MWLLEILLMVVWLLINFLVLCVSIVWIIFADSILDLGFVFLFSLSLLIGIIIFLLLRTFPIFSLHTKTLINFIAYISESLIIFFILFVIKRLLLLWLSLILLLLWHVSILSTEKFSIRLRGRFFTSFKGSFCHFVSHTYSSLV